MATFDEFYRSLPEDSGKRGEFFEKVFVPWFLRTDPEWSNKIEKIWLWDEYPDRWGKDCGIDLVYRDNTGKHWAVQSKCVSPDREISKAEINSFLSESNDPRIHGRLLIASTNGIGKNAMQVIERQEKQVVCFLREHFRQSEVEFPSTALDLATGRRKDKRRPRPHQEEAIRNVAEGLKTQDRGQLLMACGTGKTLTSLWIKEELNAKRTLVLLPSLSLLSQTLREWSATSREAFNWICVCSDKSVAKQDRTVDDWIEHVSEVGVPVTSDPAEIRQFLRNNNEGIVFSTYQSSPLVAEAQQDTDMPSFDVAFADEAHRCAGKVSEAFGCVLDSQKIRAQKRLFMTATPRVLSSRIKLKADAEDIEVASMDDESLFGTVLHRLNFSEAISKELLTDYRVVVIGVDDPEVQAQIIHRPLTTTSNGVETDYEALANHISLAKAVRDYDLQRVITFHGRVKGAKKFSEDHPVIVDWLPTSSKTEQAIKAGYVSGEMTSLERNSKINKLRNLEDGEIGILSNARCLSEGIDVPTLDGIAFIDPRSSQVDIIQAVGRAIRKSESKSYGYIILPVYLGDTENIEEEILASRFKDIWEIILALKSQDDSLTEILDRLRVELGKRGERATKSEGLTKIIFDLPERVSNTIGDTLQTILVRNTTDNWNEIYGQLLKFVDEEGHAKPRIDHPVLGSWTDSQRQNYRKRKLSTTRIQLLEALAPKGWTWNTNEGRQEKWVAAIREFYSKNGHLNIPDRDKEVGGIAKMIRQAYSGIQKYSLDQSTIDELNALRDKGWMWEVSKEMFIEKTTLLREWCVDNNSVNPPKQTMSAGNIRTYSNKTGSCEFDLGNFVTTIRSLYKLTKYRNDPEYVDDFGEITRRKRDLTAEEISLIEEIPGWYWDSWDGYARIYRECVRRGIPINNHTTVDFDLPELAGVGRWVTKMRGRAIRGELKTHQIIMTESLPDWTYDPFHDKFMEGVKRFIEFTKGKKNKSVPQSTVVGDGYRLGIWVSKVREKQKKGSLSSNQLYSVFYKKLLDQYGFEWDGGRKNRWSYVNDKNHDDE
jgi:superfamily II DNA or RNA helicase